jgi:site-specific recombinase XerD
MPRAFVPDPRLAPFLALVEDWLRTLHSRGKATTTRDTYRYALRSLGASLLAQGVEPVPTAITRQVLETWLGSLRDAGRSEQTRLIYIQAARGWLAWLVDEDELPSDPSKRVHVTAPPMPTTQIPTTATLRRILATCEGRSFVERRDHAIIRVLLDTGLRRAECARIALADIDWDRNLIHLVGKGGRQRVVRFGLRTRTALDAYLRTRRRTQPPHADSPALWIGRSGPLTGPTLYDIVRARAAQAGIDLHPHQLRHYFAHQFRSKGGQDGDLMALGGWTTRNMLDRYGAVSAQERALEAHERFSPGDDL